MCLPSKCSFSSANVPEPGRMLLFRGRDKMLAQFIYGNGIPKGLQLSLNGYAIAQTKWGTGKRSPSWRDRFKLFRVMQLVAQGLPDKTDQRVRNGIRRENLVETNRVMHASYRNGAS
jgi:hypothetical protein